MLCEFHIRFSVVEVVSVSTDLSVKFTIKIRNISIGTKTRREETSRIDLFVPEPHLESTQRIPGPIRSICPMGHSGARVDLGPGRVGIRVAVNASRAARRPDDGGFGNLPNFVSRFRPRRLGSFLVDLHPAVVSRAVNPRRST